MLLLTIGDELLDGRTLNTNAQFFGECLRSEGVPVREVRSVSDREEDIVAALEDAQKFALVLVTGGLGPTNDDRSASAAARFLRVKLEATAESLEHVRSRYRARKKKINALRLRLALLPKGARLIPNPTGTAPGFSFKKGSTVYVFLPGVPSECRPMFLRNVLPLARKLRTRSCRERLLWRTMGVSEGDLYEKVQTLVREWEKKYSGVTIGVHIKFPGVDLTLEVWEGGQLQTPSHAQVRGWEKKITHALGEVVFAREPISLVEAVIAQLRARHLTVSTAESCTGGLLGKYFTDIPGSSDVYWGGVVSYANAAKEKLLGVRGATLRRSGAVSQEIAEEMAQNIREISGADFGVSLTGIAGPGGGTAQKPVGTLYVGISDRQGSKTLHRVWEGQKNSRDMNRTFSVHFALDRLRLELLRSAVTA